MAWEVTAPEHRSAQLADAMRCGLQLLALEHVVVDLVELELHISLDFGPCTAMCAPLSPHISLDFGPCTDVRPCPPRARAPPRPPPSHLYLSRVAPSALVPFPAPQSAPPPPSPRSLHRARRHLGGVQGRYETLISGDFFSHLGPLLEAASPGQLVVSGAAWAALEPGAGSGAPLPASAGEAHALGGVRVEAMRDDGIAGVASVGAASRNYASVGTSGRGSFNNRSSGGRLSITSSGSSPPESSVMHPPRGQAGREKLEGLCVRGLPTPDLATSMIPALRCYLPPVVVEHFDAGQSSWLAENRQARSSFFFPSSSIFSFLPGSAILAGNRR